MSLPLTVIVLAAGKGTRMNSERPKVLHRLAGRSMIHHVLTTAAALAPDRVVVVLAPEMDAVAAEVDRGPLAAVIAYQEPQLGTGHAVMIARQHVPRSGDVLVLYGDTPLVEADVLQRLLEARRAAEAAVAVLGFRPPDGAGYGRLAWDQQGLAAIVEERHADETLRAEGACNAGIMAFDGARLGELLDALEIKQPKAEYYLTDVIAHARARGWPCTAIEGPFEAGLGVNSQAQLADAEALLDDVYQRADE